MNPRHSGRRYSDLLYRMAAVVGMASAVGMAALITAWVAGDAKAVTTIEICGGGNDANTCTPKNEICPGGHVIDLTGNGGGCGTPGPDPGAPIVEVLVCNDTGCVAAPVNPNAKGYTPSGWTPGPTPPSPLTGLALDPTAPGTTWINWAFSTGCVPVGGGCASGRWDKLSSLASVSQAIVSEWCARNPTHTTCTLGAYDIGGVQKCSCTGASCTPSCSTIATYSNLACSTGQEPNTVTYGSCTAAHVLPPGYSKCTGAGTQDKACQSIGAGNIARPADGKCNVKRTGNTFSGDPMDPDCVVSGMPAISANKVQAEKSVSGQDKVVAQKINPVTGESETSATVSDTTTGESGRSAVKATAPAVAAPNAATVSSSTKGTYEGVGAQTDTSPQTGGAGAGAGGELELPTDYNRETTQQAILDKLSPTAETLDPSGLDDAAAARISAVDAATGTHGITLSFNPILPSPSCSFPSFTVAGHTLDMSSWCPRIEILRTLIGLALYVATAFALYDIFTRTSGG